jgi:DNA ligase-1
MKKFTELFLSLEQADQEADKIEILGEYFRRVPAEDSAWAIFLLLVWKSKPLVTSKRLKKWTIEAAGVPEWLYQESFDAVGDLEETIALLFPGSKIPDPRTLQFWAGDRILLLSSKKGFDKQKVILHDWKKMDGDQRLIWNKLLSGKFCSPVSKELIITALAKVYKIDEILIVRRLAQDWKPSAEFYHQLVSQDSDDRLINHSSGN